MTEADLVQHKKDIRAARDIIRVGLSSYRKRMTGAKTKKQLADESGLFSDLEGYSDPDDITTAYGYGDISDDERARLLQLWDARESYKTGKYADGVTALLERAIEKVGRKYEEDIEQMERFQAEMRRHNEAAAKRKAGFRTSEKEDTACQ